MVLTPERSRIRALRFFFGGSIKTTFKGRYDIDGCVQRVTYETVDVNGLSVDMSDGSIAMGFIERNVGSKPKIEDCPNVYECFFFVDEDICMATGSSGWIFLWSKVV